MSEVRIVESVDSWRLIFPRRHPVDFRTEKAGCGCISVVLAAISTLAAPLLGALLEAFEDFHVGTFRRVLVQVPLGLVGAYALILLAWVFAGGRSEIRMTPRRLRLIERIGPLIFMVRTLPLERISNFRAHPFSTRQGCLTFDVQGAAQRRWAIEYPLVLLTEAAQALARRRDALLQGKILGPADVEHSIDSLRVNVPAVGWRLRYIVGGGAFVLLAVGVVWLGAAAGARAWPVLATLAFLGAIWLAGFRNVSRTHRLELSDAELKVVSRDYLGTRTQSWERRDVWGYEVEQDPEGGASRLRVRLRSGARPLLLDGRSAEELEWIASVLRRGRRKEEVAVTSTSSSGRGTCQVCGDPMEERIVWCRKCRTPHHRECWIYTGMCATFGCREIGYTDV